jgi:monoamine oxidase
MANAILSTSCSARCSESALTSMMREFALAGWNFGLMMDAVGGAALHTSDLVAAIAQDGGAEIRRSTPVAGLEQSDHAVAVVTRDGARFTAACAVVAVPLDTMGALEFTPPLESDKRAALAHGHAGRGVKVWARARGLDQPLLVLAPDDQLLTAVVTERALEDGTQLVVGFGPDAGRLNPDDDAAVRQAFAAMLPPEARVDEVSGHNWCTDEYARGTWSSFRPGQLAELPVLQAPHGRIVFAGSDIANGWNGFMDGAIESGLTAARSIARVLAP